MGLSWTGDFIFCDHSGCDAKIPNHKWGKIKDGANWFFSRGAEAKVFCPEHLPDWVRKKRGLDD